MEDNTKKFATSIFGFRKMDVFHYIQELNDDFTTRMREKDTEIVRLRKENFRLESELKELKAEKDKVANALIAAEEKAKEILEDAAKEAEEKRRELESDYEQERKKLQSIRAEVASVRQAAISAIERMETELSEMENSTLRKEEQLPEGKELLPQQEKAVNGAAEAPLPPTGTVTPMIRPEKPHKKVNIIKLT